MSEVATDGSKVVWFELWVRDSDAARRWYGDLFGWRFSAMTDYAPDYWQIDGPPGIGGALVSGEDSPHEGRRGTVIYLQVDNLEQTVERVVDRGGSLEQGRTAIGADGGWFAIVRDPEGIRLGLWTPDEPA